MTSLLRGMKKFNTALNASVLGRFILARKNNELNLSPYYQREYVWGDTEQQAFLNTFFSDFPFGNISVVVDDQDVIEVVDGKQRLTTLLKFYDNEIGLDVNGEKVFHRDLTDADKRKFQNWSVPTIQLMTDDYKSRVEYFAAINFSGVAQSEEHKAKVMAILAK